MTTLYKSDEEMMEFYRNEAALWTKLLEDTQVDDLGRHPNGMLKAQRAMRQSADGRG